MRHMVVLLIACIVIAYELQSAHAQFSFSLPGKWGNGKRSFSFSLPGKWGNAGKRGGGFNDCSQMDPEALFHVLGVIQGEAQRISDCLAKAENEVVAHDNEKH